MISGDVKGNVKALEKIDLTSTAKIKGDLTSQIISIQSGAVLQGQCSILNQAEHNNSTDPNHNADLEQKPDQRKKK